MVITHFSQFSPPASALGTSSADENVQEAIKTLQGYSAVQHFALGTVIQEPNIVQVISEAHTGQAITFASSSSNSLRVDFHQSLFKSGIAKANVVEYVQHFFPASQVTPGFKEKIEKDFVKFNDAFIRDVEGRKGGIFAWSMDDLDHPDITNEKARSFMICVGWESKEAFDQAIQREVFRENIGTLIAWKAPYKMWFSERKALGPDSE